MIHYLTTRLISAAVVVFGVSCLVFLMIHIIPGDPVEVMLGETASAADREALRRQLGLHQPLLTQFVEFVKGLFSFDLGESFHSKRAVRDVMAERVPASIELALASLVVAILIALPLGVIAAVRRGSRWDFMAMTFSMLGVSIPNFVMGPLLILVFSVWMRWLPVSGRDGWESLILPSLTLGTAMAAILSRMVRATLLEGLEEDYIRTARAKGLHEGQIIIQHALRNATLPIITVIGLQLGTLLGGAVITEIVFSWPGVGHLTIESIQRRDYSMLQACVLVISFAYVFVNTATDILYAWLDPRVRLQ